MTILILLIYFALGAVGTAFYARRKPVPVRKEIWTKYLVFLFLTMTLVTLMLLQWLTYLTIVFFIIVTGLIEILRLYKKIPFVLLLCSVLAYLLIAYGFWKFHVEIPVSDIFIVFVLVITLDGFSQLSGQLFGRMKIVPAVSPNKTLEGYLGGVAMTIATAYLIHANTSWWVLCFALAGAIAGDLSASWLKRKAGIKDFSNLIPGHGGILDRYDSYIMAGAFAMLALVL